MKIFEIIIDCWYAATHPLDPLTSEEISTTRDVIEASKKRAATRYIYNYITLQEPPKSVLLPFFLGNTDPPMSVYPRKSFSVLIERGTWNVYECVVNLDTKQVESMVQVFDVQPSLSPEDLLLSEVQH